MGRAKTTVTSMTTLRGIPANVDLNEYTELLSDLNGDNSFILISDLLDERNAICSKYVANHLAVIDLEDTPLAQVSPNKLLKETLALALASGSKLNAQKADDSIFSWKKLLNNRFIESTGKSLKSIQANENLNDSLKEMADTYKAKYEKKWDCTLEPALRSGDQVGLYFDKSSEELHEVVNDEIIAINEAMASLAIIYYCAKGTTEGTDYYRDIEMPRANQVLNKWFLQDLINSTEGNLFDNYIIPGSTDGSL